MISILTKKCTQFTINTKTVNYNNVNDSMTGMAASALDAVTASSVSAFHSGIQRT